MSDDLALEELDLGGAPRPPLPARTRRVLAAAGAVVALAAVTVIAVVAWGHDPASPTPRPTPSAAAGGAGFAAGPVLTEVDGRTELTVPGGAMFGAAAMNVALAAAPDKVAVVRRFVPTFHQVRGGTVVDPDIHYGLYLSGAYTAADGSTVDLTLYTARSPGTTYGADEYVSRGRFDHSYSVRTEVSVFTGSGWWVHLVAIGPDNQAGHLGQAALLRPVADDPDLVAT